MLYQRKLRLHMVSYLIIVLVINLFSATNIMAQTKNGSGAYFVDVNGDDNSSGSKTTPWKTIAKLNVTRFNPGDTIYFKATQVFKGTLSIRNKGSRANRITITSYGNGKALIDGGNGEAIAMENTAFITIANLQLKGSGRKSGNTADGLSITNCSNIIADNINITGFRNAGLLIATSNNIRVTKIDARDNGFAGISIAGTYMKKESCRDIYVGHCRAENNPGSPAILNNHSGNGIIAGNCSRVMIEYCTATNNGWDMPRVGNGPVGIWCYEADRVTIQHCLSYRNKTAKGADDGGGFDFDGGVTNSVIQYCFSYENEGSAFGLFQYVNASPWNNNTVRYNISENDGTVSAAKAGFYIWNNTSDSTQLRNCYVYNNTIYNTKAAIVNFASQGKRQGFYFYNNIFVATDSLLKGSAGNDEVLANNWWSIGNGFNANGDHKFSNWARQNNNEMLNGQLIGTNHDPGFTKRKMVITSAEQLRNLTHYRLAKTWAISGGIDLKKIYGISTGNKSFGGRTAPAKGVGAAF